MALLVWELRVFDGEIGISDLRISKVRSESVRRQPLEFETDLSPIRQTSNWIGVAGASDATSLEPAEILTSATLEMKFSTFEMGFAR